MSISSIAASSDSSISFFRLNRDIDSDSLDMLVRAVQKFDTDDVVLYVRYVDRSLRCVSLPERRPLLLREYPVRLELVAADRELVRALFGKYGSLQSRKVGRCGFWVP